MEAEQLSNRARFVRILLTTGTVLLSVLAYYLAIAYFYHDVYPSAWNIANRDFWLTAVFIIIYWSAIDTWLNLNEVYRSRSYGYILLFNVIESIIGVMMLTFTIMMLGLPNFGRDVLILFGGLSTLFCFSAKILFYKVLRVYRKKGYNIKKVFFVCDRGGESLLNSIITRFEWGYEVVAIAGDEYIANKFKDKVKKIYQFNYVNLETLLTQDLDEVIYARKYDNSQEILKLVDLCSDLGITFRLYSPFLNRLSSNTQLRYFDTNTVFTISNTPNNYFALLVKRIMDIVASTLVIVLGFPFFAIIALLIKIDSRGPVFFKQKRSGLKGKEFNVYKFRTMVVNAEALKDKLKDQNEMTGPVFKMTNDPRITRLGRLLRKSGIDEFPQFINVFKGDMSIVGPRPPLPAEVAEYERWMLRRLAMKPGITCLWQTARNRNSITFEEWMRMDMEYIDNWSLTLDMVIILKTIRTVFRADGK